MEPEHRIRLEIRYLVSLSLENEIADHQVERLNHLLETSPPGREHYLNLIQIAHTLRSSDWTAEYQDRLEQQQEPQDVDLPPDTQREGLILEYGAESLALLREMLDNGDPLADSEPDGRRVDEVRRASEARLAEYLAQEHARLRELGQPKPSRGSWQLRELTTAIRWTLRAGRVSLWTSTAALIALLVGVLFFTLVKPVPVATLAGTVNARWVSQAAPVKGDRFFRSQKCQLLDGFALLGFDCGATVLVEAPAQFELRAAQCLALHSGKAFLRVGPQSQGFVIVTPDAEVVDLGTEIGVEVRGGAAGVHLITGRASVRPRDSKVAGGERLLHSGQAVSVDAAGRMTDIAFANTKFARQINDISGRVWRGEPLRLADIVGGGDGFGSGRMNFGISVLTGQARWPVAKGRGGRRMYVAVPENPFVDGVFVPEGSRGQVQVNSQGDEFVECPTTDNRVYTDIFSGSGRIVPDQRAPLVLNGIEYGTSDRDALFMHANAGISFDLRTIRQAYPGLEITQFQAVCGIPGTLRTEGVPYERHGGADFWILVDGQVRFVWRKAMLGEAQEVAVALKPCDRFLTLVTTDGGDEHGTLLDWCTFGSPNLELQHRND